MFSATSGKKSLLHTLNYLIVLLFLSWTAVAMAATSKIGILVFDGALTSDITAPAEVFGSAAKQKWFSAYEVILIAVSKNKQIKTEEGLKIVADASIADNIRPDILIVPGAYDVAPQVKNKALIQYIRETAKTARWLGSNCAGAFILGAAGILDGHKVTTWHGGEKQLQKQYVRAKVQFNKNVVISENLVTSQGGIVSYDAAMFLLEQISSSENARKISRLVHYTPAQKGLLCEQKHQRRAWR
jgi:transcriptional regulator GlxA family with amidase domain